MHLWLALHPIPHWGSLQRSLAGLNGPTSKGEGKGTGKKEKVWREKEEGQNASPLQGDKRPCGIRPHRTIHMPSVRYRLRL